MIEGDYYVYITADDGVNKVGSYSGLLTIDHPDDPPDDGGDGGGDGGGNGGGDNGGDDDPGDTNVNDMQGESSILWLLFWIILVICVIVALLIGMVYRSRRNAHEETTCDSCNKQFPLFDPKASSADCPHCGESNQINKAS